MTLTIRLAFFLALCWIPVFATGCSNGFVLMPDVSQLRSIHIQDNWMGISPISPTVVSYTLQNQGDYFGGQAFFDIRGLSTTQSITIPIEKVDSFLKTLATAPIEEGEYIPTFRYTDDYPDIRFHMRFISETVEFSTGSQGKDHSPWRVTVDDKMYISSSHIPMQSFAILEPYLARDLLNQMIDRRMRQPP
ncbi:hypothetical protein TFLX_00819 [Thermoflexales bacterium]|nr:hypothetical protein TFLX_00819 [Thermoflexales bacterium]